MDPNFYRVANTQCTTPPPAETLDRTRGYLHSHSHKDDSLRIYVLDYYFRPLTGVTACMPYCPPISYPETMYDQAMMHVKGGS